MDGFKFTDDQLLALKLIGGTVKNLLLFGGSRSGKTLVLLFSIVLRAIKAPGDNGETAGEWVLWGPWVLWVAAGSREQRLGRFVDWQSM